MTYYKIMVDGALVGYADQDGLRRFQEKHKIILTADETNAQFVQLGETLYRDNWLKPFSGPVEYIDAKIISMGQEEYEEELGL